MAIISIIYPSRKSDTRRCIQCGCPDLLEGVKEVVLSHTSDPYHLYGSGNCVVEGTRYSYDVDISIDGDSMSGHISFTNRKNKTITSNLASTQTSYPSLPYINEWPNIKIPGFGDNAVLVVKDSRQTSSTQVKKTNSLTAVFSLTAINTPDNTLVANSASSIAPLNCSSSSCLPYSENIWLWQKPKTSIDTKVAEVVGLPTAPIQEDPTGGFRSAINVSLNSLAIEENFGSFKLNASITTQTMTSESTWIKRFVIMSSDDIVINNSFKTLTTWSQKVTIADTVNPATGLVRTPSKVFPFYSPDLHLILEITLAGQFDTNKALRS